MDIMRYGPDVLVAEPETLRDGVKLMLNATLNLYRNNEECLIG
jgi:hypothetical protein